MKYQTFRTQELCLPGTCREAPKDEKRKRLLEAHTKRIRAEERKLDRMGFDPVSVPAGLADILLGK